MIAIVVQPYQPFLVTKCVVEVAGVEQLLYLCCSSLLSPFALVVGLTIQAT